ncbi:MAG: hypothetical protein K2P84_07280, partial [Undibacterium sp.]|nr:hypothetical protein [Undibacterium sp.]
MLRSLNILSCLLTVLFFSDFSSAQTPPPVNDTAPAHRYRWDSVAEIAFEHHATTLGLPQEIVTSLAQDDDGFFWIGTQGGLARWDGYHFRHYLHQAKDLGSVPDPFISVLFLDHRKQLWVGTNAGGLARYDKKNDRFIQIPIGKNGLNHSSVISIAADGNKGLWIATLGGLNHYNLDTGHFTYFTHDAKDSTSLPSNFVTSALLDQAGNLWVGTDLGLVKREAGSTRFLAVPLSIDNPQVHHI